MGRQTSATGERGVLKVIDELLARGFNPYRPVVDTGVDIMLSSGLRIQVKAANLTYHRKRKNGDPHYRAYAFSPEGLEYKYRSPEKPIFSWVQTKKTSQVDFYVLVGLNENRFWIVASKHLACMYRVKIREGVSRSRNHGDRETDWTAIRSGEGNWELLRNSVTADCIDPNVEALQDFYKRGDDTVATFAAFVN